MRVPPARACRPAEVKRRTTDHRRPAGPHRGWTPPRWVARPGCASGSTGQSQPPLAQVSPTIGPGGLPRRWSTRRARSPHRRNRTTLQSGSRGARTRSVWRAASWKRRAAPFASGSRRGNTSLRRDWRRVGARGFWRRRPKPTGTRALAQRAGSAASTGAGSTPSRTNAPPGRALGPSPPSRRVDGFVDPSAVARSHWLGCRQCAEAARQSPGPMWDASHWGFPSCATGVVLTTLAAGLVPTNWFSREPVRSRVSTPFMSAPVVDLADAERRPVGGILSAQARDPDRTESHNHRLQHPPFPAPSRDGPTAMQNPAQRERRRGGMEIALRKATQHGSGARHGAELGHVRGVGNAAGTRVRDGRGRHQGGTRPGLHAGHLGQASDDGTPGYISGHRAGLRGNDRRIRHRRGRSYWGPRRRPRVLLLPARKPSQPRRRVQHRKGALGGAARS